MNNIFIFTLFIIIVLITLNRYYFICEPFEFDNFNNFGLLKKYNNFITDFECDYLINITNGKFIDSTVLSDDLSNYIDKTVRSSQNYYFQKSENKIIENIERKISCELNIPIENIEPIQMVKYDFKQEYLPHYDYIYEDNNQRTHTFIIYLNTLYEKEGGSTNFVNYNKKIYPVKGNAICFNNIDSFGRLNLMSLHGGEKIKGNKSKFILSIWIRKNKYIN